MPPPGPYSFDLMTRVLLGLGPPAAPYTPHEEPAPSWEKDVRKEPLSLPQSALILSNVVNTLDRQSVGWLPPLYPSSRPYVNHNLPSTSIPIISDLLKRDTFDRGYPDIDHDGADSTSSESTSSTPTRSAFTRSPSPFVPAQGLDVGPARTAEDETESLEPSPLATLREKERKRIRQSSGVKPKAKVPQPRGLRNVEATPSSSTPLEMVQCQWGGCTKRLYVDYINVEHWGKHVREHYADERDTIQCQWEGGCGDVVNKSSMWKHVVRHQSKFKIRCPYGCGVSTRGDMMNRHRKTCNYTPGKVAKSGKDNGKENVKAGEEGDGGDYDDDGEDSEEEGRED